MPDSLIIDRFGLTFDFIEKHGLTWIDNLITSSGTDLANPKTKEERAEAGKAYVVNYIQAYGPRKCEANALTPVPEIAHQLCLNTIHKYIDRDAAEEFAEFVKEQRAEVRVMIAELMGGD